MIYFLWILFIFFLDENKDEVELLLVLGFKLFGNNLAQL